MKSNKCLSDVRPGETFFFIEMPHSPFKVESIKVLNDNEGHVMVSVKGNPVPMFIMDRVVTVSNV